MTRRFLRNLVVFLFALTVITQLEMKDSQARDSGTYCIPACVACSGFPPPHPIFLACHAACIGDAEADQACDALTVNAIIGTPANYECTAFGKCTPTNCTLKEAFEKARTCATDQTITFDTTDPAPKLASTTMDNQALSLETAGGDLGKKITIDGGTGRFLFQAVPANGKDNLFIIKRDNVAVKNLIIKDYNKEAIKVDTGKNFDLFNTQATSTSATFKPLGFTNDASPDNSGKNGPIFVHQLGSGSDYIVYGILPIDSKLYGYSTSNGVDLQGNQLNVTGNDTSTPETKEVKGNTTATFPTLKMYAWKFSGVTGSAKVYLLRKDKDKNVVLDHVIDPLCKDDDNDGLCNQFETAFGSKPDNADSDGDGKTDFEESVLLAGSDIYPLATDTAFIALDSDANGTPDVLQPAAAAAPTSQGTPAATEEKSGGCSLLKGGESSAGSTAAFATILLFCLATLTLPRRSFRRVKK